MLECSLASPQPRANSSPGAAKRATSRMRFRLTTIAYAFALLAAAMATFGTWGILVAAIVWTFWIACLRTPSTPVTFWMLLATLLLLTALILPPILGSARGAVTRSDCLNNLKQLSIALENYHHKHGSYPPAYISDAQGKPIHSWRVLLLPFMEEGELYRDYNFDEPWDGPNNRKLWDRMPAVYGCPGREWLRSIVGDRLDSMPANAASYFAIVDETTAWPGARPLKMAEITDDPSQTMLLIEHSGMAAPWTAPVDLTLEQALALFKTSKPSGHIHVSDGFFTAGSHRSYSQGVYADGHVKITRSEMPPKVARALFTIGGSEDLNQWSDVDDDDLSWTPKPRPEIYVLYERVYAFSAFVILALLPLLRLLFCRTALAAAPASC